MIITILYFCCDTQINQVLNQPYLSLSHLDSNAKQLKHNLTTDQINMEIPVFFDVLNIYAIQFFTLVVYSIISFYSLSRLTSVNGPPKRTASLTRLLSLLSADPIPGEHHLHGEGLPHRPGQTLGTPRTCRPTQGGRGNNTLIGTTLMTHF